MSDSNVQTLTNSLIELVQTATHSVDDINKLLAPISGFFGNPDFMTGINRLVATIIQDRDGNNQFDMNDIKLLANDMDAIVALVNATVLTLSTIPNIGFSYNSAATEELIFKVLTYVFLVVVPKAANLDLTTDQKVFAINLVLGVYNIAKSSSVVQAVLDKIKSYFRTKGWCKCVTDPDAANAAVATELDLATRSLNSTLQKSKDMVRMQRELAELRAALAK